MGGGDQDYCSFLETLVREKSLTEHVQFFGQVDNAFPYIKKANVLLLCSRCEAFARVVVEAMKAGKPVLGTRSGGTVEQIEAGFNGFLYEPGDFKELAAKIRYLQEHPDKAKEMGKNAKNWARKTFNRKHYQEKIKEIMSKL
ncbi:MAG: glycosyltransferase [Syntrophobacterales bacterium]